MKVFLSSTGRDLKAYREAAFNAIQGLHLHCVRMEDFHGPAIKIEDFDDQRIDECNLFVIILGHLHGTCPEGSEKSYTELEYETAQRLKKPCFLFLAPEDFSFPASLIENDDKRAEQRAFRERAVKGVIRQTSYRRSTFGGIRRPSQAHFCRFRHNLTSLIHIHCRRTSLADCESAACSRSG